MSNNFESLYNLYCENNNCDLFLISEEDEKIQVHIIIIAAGIPKLRDIILASYDVYPRIGLKVVGVKSRELKQIIQFAYLGRCEIKEDAYEALDLLEASTRLRMDDKLQIKALEAVERNINMTLAVNLLTPAQKCNPFIKPAISIAETYVTRYLADCDNAINDIPLVNLKALIRDDRLHAPHEELVVEIILQWINHDRKTRLQYMPQLLQLLRLGFINLDFLDLAGQIAMSSYVQLEFTSFQLDSTSLFLLNLAGHKLALIPGCSIISLHTDLQERGEVLENSEARAMLEISLGTVLSLQSSQDYVIRSIVNYLPLAVRPRVPHVTILALGGYAQGVLNVVEVYDHLADQWNVVSKLDLILKRSYHSAEKIGDFLYIVGGMDENENPTNTGQRLNLKTLEWQSIASMKTPRCYPATATVNGLLYVFGGKYLSSSRLKTCEVYDPNTNSWKYIKPMARSRSDAGVAVLNGKIYLSGGFNSRSSLSNVEVYDPITNKWSNIEPLIQRRTGHKCAVYRGNIYVIGGFTGFNRLKRVEKYNPMTRKWTILSEMHTPRNNFGLTQFYDYFIVCGGYIGNGVTDKVEIYDILHDTWYPLNSLSIPTSGTYCVAVDDVLFSLMTLSSQRHHSSLLRDLTCERPNYNPDSNNQTLPQGSKPDEQLLQIIEDNENTIQFLLDRMPIFIEHGNFMADHGDN